MKCAMVQTCLIYVAVVSKNEPLTFTILFNCTVGLFDFHVKVPVGSANYTWKANIDLFIVSNISSRSKKFPYLVHLIDPICVVVGNSLDYSRFFLEICFIKSSMSSVLEVECTITLTILFFNERSSRCLRDDSFSTYAICFWKSNISYPPDTDTYLCVLSVGNKCCFFWKCSARSKWMIV